MGVWACGVNVYIKVPHTYLSDAAGVFVYTLGFWVLIFAAVRIFYFNREKKIYYIYIYIGLENLVR